MKVFIPPVIVFAVLYGIWLFTGRVSMPLDVFWFAVLFAVIGIRAIDKRME